MGWRNDQCKKVCRIIDIFLANRPTERDSLIVAVQKAFNALEQAETNCSEIPNNSDTISRQQAIDALDKRFGNVPMEQTAEILMLRKDLRELPFVQPEMSCSEIPNNWIPCSERLPKESRKYLVTVFDGIGKRTTSAPYHRRSKSWTLTGRMAYWKVIAWMPLPEIYQEGGE